MERSELANVPADPSEQIDYENLDYSQGIIMALIPKPGDPDYPENSTEVAPTADQIAGYTTPAAVPVSDGIAMDQIDPQVDALAYALAGHNFRSDVVIGSEVFHDLLRAVANQSVTNQTSQVSAAQIRQTAMSIAEQVRPLLAAADASVEVRFFYARDYLANLIRRTYVDPQVYSYRGPFHRIVHRRYSRGRGIVWRRVNGILYSELTKFEGMAQRELMGVSSERMSFRLYRSANTQCGTTAPSFVRLYHNGNLVGRPVTYREMKNTVTQAQGLISQVSQAISPQ